jgi:hypothetical protein
MYAVVNANPIGWRDRFTVPSVGFDSGARKGIGAAAFPKMSSRKSLPIVRCETEETQRRKHVGSAFLGNQDVVTVHAYAVSVSRATHNPAQGQEDQGFELECKPVTHRGELFQIDPLTVNFGQR